MADIAALTEIIEPEAKALGFDLVRVAMIGGTGDPTLQIMAERPDTRQLSLTDCADLSRRVSERFDALEAEGADPIEAAYRLEVSSPGIDRPLTRAKDYDDWRGHEARVALAEPMDGRKSFSGELGGIEGDAIRIGAALVPLARVKSAKLLITDKLIAATAPLAADEADQISEIEEEEQD